MRKTIYFIRHAQTEFNRLGIVQGSGVDSDLNEKGIEQGKAFYNAYANIDFDIVMTSKLKRTQQTVSHFINDGIEWEMYAELNEMSWGIHEGQKGTPEMAKSYQTMVKSWNAGDYSARVLKGESAYELGERVDRFLNLLKTREEKRILICTHGRTMSAVSCLLERRPLKEMYFYKNHNTALTKVIYDGTRFAIQKLGDTSHLQR